MKKEKVLVLGGGFISNHLPSSYSRYTDRITTSGEGIASILDYYRADVVVNCIGRTGTKNIDSCETNQSVTAEANTVLPILIAQAANDLGIRMLHIGSGCINYGPSPRYQDDFGRWLDDRNYIDPGWRESDFSAPLSYYSKSKYAADLAIGSMPNVSILRIRMPISSHNSPRNLLNKLIGYNQVLEEPNSMTFVEDLVNAVQWAIDNGKTGIYNIASPKPLTHSMLLDEYKKHVPTHTYEKISKEELTKLVVAPRSNCILDVSKSMNEGFVYGDINDRIKTTIEQFVNNRSRDGKV